MARRRLHGFVRPPKKTVMWIGSTPQTAPISIPAASAVLVLVLSAGALALRPFTIMRSRGIILVHTDQIAGSEEPFGIYGDIVVSDSAAAAGIGSIPTPNTEAEAAWLVYVPLATTIRFGDATGFSNVSNVFEYDSKAMRKVGIDDELVGVCQNVSSTHGMEIVIVGRALIQLH